MVPCLSIWLQFSRRMIVKVLRTKNEDAIVRLPTAAETTLFASMIHKKQVPFDNFFLLGSNDGWSETQPAVTWK